MDYVGIGPERGVDVSAYDAVDFALERCGLRRIDGRELCGEFMRWFEDWYFSGNWLTKEDYERIVNGKN